MNWHTGLPLTLFIWACLIGFIYWRLHERRTEQMKRLRAEQRDYWRSQ